MVSKGMGTEIGVVVTLDDDTVDRMLDLSCMSLPETSDWCRGFNSCSDCLRAALRQYRKRVRRDDGMVYVVSRLPYGSHGAPAGEPAALVGVYGTLEDAEAEVMSKDMRFMPTRTSSEDGRIVFEYALDGEESKVMAGANFPQYVIARYELR